MWKIQLFAEIIFGSPKDAYKFKKWKQRNYGG